MDSKTDEIISIRADGFSLLSRSASDESIAAALGQKTTRLSLNRLALVLGVQAAEILLLDRGYGTRKGKKTGYVNLYYLYNPVFNDHLKETGAAFFSRASKNWSIPDAQWNSQVLCDKYKDYFSYIIDADTGEIFQNQATPSMVQLPEPRFDMLASSVLVDEIEVRDSIDIELWNSYKERAPEINGLFIHTGNNGKFVKYEGGQNVWTNLPFLVLRYSIPTGRPRYVAYHTLEQDIVLTTYHNTKDCKLLLSDYLDTCAHYKQPAFFNQESEYYRQ